jgi:hypothetical protein
VDLDDDLETADVVEPARAKAKSDLSRLERRIVGFFWGDRYGW